MAKGLKSPARPQRHHARTQNNRLQMTTHEDYPISYGSQVTNWAPSLLSWAFAQERLKLSHLLAKHWVQHCLLMGNLLTELLRKGVLETLYGCGLSRNGAFKMDTLLMELSPDLLHLGCSFLGLLLGGIGNCLGLTLQLLHLMFQDGHPLVMSIITINFHGSSWDLCQHFLKDFLRHIFKGVSDLKRGCLGGQTAGSFGPRIILLDVVTLHWLGHHWFRGLGRHQFWLDLLRLRCVNFLWRSQHHHVPSWSPFWAALGSIAHGKANPGCGSWQQLLESAWQSIHSSATPEPLRSEGCHRQRDLPGTSVSCQVEGRCGLVEE